jgi:adenosylcobinamide-GDP ribazoletransferase
VVLRALRGAVGFLTRVPIGRSESAWMALGEQPAVMVLAAYAVGGLVAVPVVVPLPPVTVGVGFVLAVLAVTGITHLDGLADLGDAAVVHGSPARRREVMRDTTLGVGGSVALGLALVGLALAGVGLAGLPLREAVGTVVAAEVGAKLAMVGLASVGEATHDGLGSHLTGATERDLGSGAVLALPALGLTWPSPVAAVSLLAGLVASAVVLAWARARLGGVSGDVFGATNEVARLAALHAGVVAWTLS